MKNTIGNSVTLTLFGESHGPAIGAVLDGIAPGIKVDEGFIAAQLARRRPCGPTDTPRVEKDEFSILSGVYEGFTTGQPLAIVIPNENVRSADYEKGIARPSHADFTAHAKFHGFEDPRGGGHFSGRVTAAIVAAGAICRQALEAKGISLATHILSCAGVRDEDLAGCDPDELGGKISTVNAKSFPVILDIEAEVSAGILKAREQQDSIGGTIQTAICGVPAGVGEPWFDSLEGMIARAVFAIGGIKGVEFGKGFAMDGLRGSQVNDSLRIRDGKVVTATNNNGGINGGISNGMPIVFNMAVKPTPSIARTQQSVDFLQGKEVELNLKGRHDPAIIRRICPVVSSLTAVVLCDALALRYGTDWLAAR